MQIIFFIFLIIAFCISLIISFVPIVFIGQDLWYGKKKNAPFVPAPDVVMGDLIAHISIAPDSVVYDLGSGDGKVLRALYEKNKTGTFVGIERGVIPHILACIKHRTIQNLSFKRKDFFDIHLSDANVVVLYLFPELLDALLPKLNTELKAGAVVYSLDFQFSERKPDEVISFDQTRKRGKNLYKYIF
mgnify:CR=1 FL=1|jgi:hypothetical protein